MLQKRATGQQAGASAGQATVTHDAASARAIAIQRSYMHYSGHPRKPLVARQGEVDDNLLICLGRLIVDKGVSFLWGQDVPFQVTDARPEQRQDWLDECWRRNKRELTLQKFATNGAICGHAFARLLERKATGPGPAFPRLVILDPATVDVVTNPDDIEDVWRYTITPPPAPPEEGEPARKRRTLIANGSGQAGYNVRALSPEAAAQSWTITDQIEQAGTWVTTATEAWPWPFSPIIDCQNLPKPNDYWGESDLPEDVLHVLDGINRVASHYNKIIRVHAHPKIWTRGMGSRTLDVGIDTVIHLPSETSELRSLEMQSDLGSTKALLDELLTLLAMMVRIPLVALGQPDNLGAASGVSLKIRYQPLLEKTELKRRTYGDAAIEMDRRLLAMGGYGDTTITTMQWPALLPVDDLLDRQVAVLDDSLGLVSKETLASKFGYDWEAEQKQLAQEKAAEPPPPLPAVPGTAPRQTGAPAVPAAGTVPPPEPIPAPIPDIAKRAKST